MNKSRAECDLIATALNSLSAAPTAGDAELIGRARDHVKRYGTAVATDSLIGQLANRLTVLSASEARTHAELEALDRSHTDLSRRLGEAGRDMESASAEIERLREALRPFAEAAGAFEPHHLDSGKFAEYVRLGHSSTRILNGSLRRARQALAPATGDGEQAAQAGGSEL
jgi:hypothetical protein